MSSVSNQSVTMNHQASRARVIAGAKANVRAAVAFIGLLLLVTIVNLALYLPSAEAVIQPSPAEELIIGLTNAERAKAGLKPLAHNSRLARAAKAKAEDMFTRRYFDHISPSGRTPWGFIKEADYNYLKAGENLAIDFTSPRLTVPAWMASPSHRANILKPEYKEIGLALVEGEFNGRQTTIIVQMFGSPQFTLFGY